MVVVGGGTSDYFVVVEIFVISKVLVQLLLHFELHHYQDNYHR